MALIASSLTALIVSSSAAAPADSSVVASPSPALKAAKILLTLLNLDRCIIRTKLANRLIFPFDCWRSPKPSYMTTRRHAELLQRYPYAILPQYTLCKTSHANPTRAGQALAQCLQESDCIMVQRNTPQDCLRSPQLEQLPMKCQQLKKGFSECKYVVETQPPPSPKARLLLVQRRHSLHYAYNKRGMVDMRKRFRGNAPVALTKETDATTGEVVEKRAPVPQLYAGKPAVQSIKETSGDEFQMDPEKTRGL
ncbi:predicted protein [Uncinocarpus reesii 1704]|uniref:Uncharacterized protein n=1 Tax=Uncinocarpus reesii (strain UAMH 1704) TaxID=336963 RepID=C4JLN2_UNCRE|nr:uncharacterized protein UREG_03740 [Uncinocarpus reesii 1704]EEP78894.1 predicted protein [Uncinocarpus reesii 1704]